MNSDVLKAILLFVMTMLSIICGLLPIKVYARLDAYSHQRSMRNVGQLIISIITCFAGGVFLGVCLLDVFPDALEAWKNVQEQFAYDSDYPFVSLLCGLGILGVWFFEEFTIICHNYANKQLDAASNASSSEEDVEGDILRQRKATMISRMSSSEPLATETSFVRSLTFVSAFVFHCALEGFAFGIQDDTVSITSLFVGIALHKAVVFFSIGIRLTKAHPHKVQLIIAMVVFVAVTAPIGGAIGIVVKDSDINEKAKNVSMLVLSCLSLGTFLYITFFELLGPEKENKHANFVQWGGAVAGFVLIAIIMIFSD